MKSIATIIILTISLSLFSQKELPNVELETLEGKKVNLREIDLGEKVVIFSLWASWCVPCINELDTISEVYDEWTEEYDTALYAISVDDSRTIKRVRPLVNGKDWPYEILFDKNSDLFREFNISGIPFTFMVKDGKIIYKHSGYSPGAEDELLEVLEEHSN